MKQLILTSSVHSVVHDIATKLELTNNNKLVFITTPAEPEEGNMSWLDNDRESLIKAGFDVTDYTITNKDREQIKSDLNSFDYIYVSGGNTFYLLEQSQKTGFISLVQDWINSGSKIYIGTSAGSIIAGDKCPDYLLEEDEVVELENKNGYGLVNFTVLPHWGSSGFKDKYISDRLEIAYKKDQVPLITLTDKQYIWIKNDQMNIVDVSN